MRRLSGFWSLVSGSWFLFSCSWFLVPRSWFWALVSWLLVLGFLVLDCWFWLPFALACLCYLAWLYLLMPGSAWFSLFLSVALGWRMEGMIRVPAKSGRRAVGDDHKNAKVL